MRKIIKGFDKMPAREVMDCRNTAIRNVLRFYGVVIDSYLQYILGSGLNFKLHYIRSGKNSSMECCFVTGLDIKLDEILFKNMSIPIKMLDIGNKEQDWKLFKEYIDVNVPVITVIDSSVVNTSRLVKERPGLLIGTISMAPLIGYDLENKSAYLNFMSEDPKILYEMPISVFMNARNTRVLPYSPSNKCYTMEVKEGYNQWLKKNMKDLVETGIKKICENMLEPEGEGIDKMGIMGIRSLVDNLESFSSAIDNCDLDDEIVKRLFTIQLNVLRIGFAAGSDTFFRNELGKGLELASDIFKCPELRKVGLEFFEIGKEWRNLIRFLAVAPYKTNEKKPYLERLIGMLKTLADDEEKLFFKISKAI